MEALGVGPAARTQPRSAKSYVIVLAAEGILRHVSVGCTYEERAGKLEVLEIKTSDIRAGMVRRHKHHGECTALYTTATDPHLHTARAAPLPPTLPGSQFCRASAGRHTDITNNSNKGVGEE
ncbi:hypothetical protein E2C01_046006 [Portunus trituberculatus]|uniref:Uncharacterized protein n=1 Tax=Portunus trituberculatus TaxID=210409 RepID=A0A5B7G3X1_PORTR|nr:hypothetical protein [Portunus trituberculatus]